MRGKSTDEVAFGLAEADGPQPSAPRSRRWPVVTVAVLVTAVIAAVAIRVEYAVLARPDAPPAPQRILPAVAPVDAGGTYRFADRVKGRPVTYAARARGASLNESDRIGDVLEENETVTLTQNVTAG